MRPRFQVFTLLAVTAAVLSLQSAQTQAEARRDTDKKKPRPVVRPTFDKSAERVALFDGMKAGTLETKVVAMGPSKGYVIIGNSTDKPVTVELPKSFVTVPTKVLKQFGAMGGGGFGGGGLGGGGLGGGGLGGGGGQQNQGGGFGGGQQGGLGGGLGGGGLGGGGMGQGFFSIPPEKAVKVPYVSACLNHGKADPSPYVDYSIIPVEMYTSDPVLRELIELVGTGRLPQQAAQAAVWNRTDHLSWQQLATKTTQDLVGRRVPYFRRADLVMAQQIAATAVGRAREKAKQQPESQEPQAPRTVGARVR